MPAPRELPQQIPAPLAKARMQKPQVGANFWYKSLGVRGGMVMAKIDSCIRELFLLCEHFFYFILTFVKTFN